MPEINGLKSGRSPQLKCVFFVPDSHKEIVKNAMFASGAGGLGDYDCCSWETLGTGQFRPKNSARPFIGDLDSLCFVSEWRVEMLVPKEKKTNVISALIESHPYEHPAYELLLLAE